MCNREKQCGFRNGRLRMDQVFAVRQVGKKYLGNGKDVFWASVDLEKAYDTIARHSIWQISGKVRKIDESSAEFLCG